VKRGACWVAGSPQAASRLLELRIQNPLHNHGQLWPFDIGARNQREKHLPRARDECRGTSGLHGADDIPSVGRYQASISGLDLECGRVARPVEHPVASQ